MKIHYSVSMIIAAVSVAAMVGAAQNTFAEKSECPEVCTRDKVAAEDNSRCEKPASATCAVTGAEVAEAAAKSCDPEKEDGECAALTQLTCDVGTCQGDDDDADTYVSNNTESNNPEFRWPFRNA